MDHLKDPDLCRSMPELRDAIDALDRDLVHLLAHRARFIDRAVVLKRENGWPARIPSRVEDVVANVRETAQHKGLDPDLIERLWRDLIDWSIAREAQSIDLE
ncbi:MAG: chorismate mutase [Pelagimonas sp.]|jgi:isochorismate pyruvate lyase|nr:chorismate mutase [Pelagimonas sp.]